MTSRRPQAALLPALLALATVAHAQSNVAEQYLIAAANQERAAQGIALLVPDPALAAAARNHAGLMAQHKDISHQFSGEASLSTRIEAYGQRFDTVAENVAYSPTVDRIHTGWMNSPGHRANLLNPVYNRIGVAVLVNGGEIYSVEDFGHSAGSEPALIQAHRSQRPAQDAADISQEALLLFNTANLERAQRNAPKLRWDPTLAKAAAFHAVQMAQRGTISHQFAGEPDLSARGSTAGARFSLITENVAEAPSTTRVHAAWMQSQGHRENILDANVDSVGIAVVVRNGQRYAVQDFARTTQSLTLEQQEAAVGALLDSAGLSLMPETSDARSTCTTSSGFHGANQPGFVMRYTSANLDVLPDQLAPHLTTGKYRQASVGACAQNDKGPFSTYRIAILLYP